MKKRIFMLALVVGVLLSFSASAWASIYYKIDEVKVLSRIYGASDDMDNASMDIQITIGMLNWSVDVSGYAKSADVVSWDTSNMTLSQSTVTFDTVTQASEDNYYKVLSSVAPSTLGSTATWTFKLKIEGTLKSADKDVTVSVALNSTTTGDMVTATGVGETEEKVEVTTLTESEFANIYGDPTDPRNPYGTKWDGLDPKFTNPTISTNYDKAKPKLGKFAAKTDLDFTAGTSKDLDVPLVGPITEVDVYIAVKDAIKFGWLEKGATNNIQLTKENIRKYNIPFRVTSYDFATTVEGSAEKDIKKNWKSAKNTLTISFNGGHYQLKGYPITISMANKNTNSKPVAKAIKLNVTPNDGTPAWTYVAESEDASSPFYTYNEAYEWVSADKDNRALRGVLAKIDDEYTFVSGNSVATSADWELDGTYTVDTPFKSKDVDNDNKDEYFTIPSQVVSYDEDEDETKHIVDNSNYQIFKAYSSYKLLLTSDEVYGKKDKPEASAVVDVAGKSAGTISETYTVSADGPYFVTVKPDPTKDKTKLEKFFDTGYSVTITDPVFDYLGKVTTPASVTITGKPKEKTKESKLALTLTAQNGSTKKKGALKVTASGKLAPYFETGKGAVKSGDTVYVTTKRVEAGKTPSVKFKAKGSKTIAYKLGAWTWDEDAKDVVDGDEDASYYKDMLEALKLSFDAKKGQVVLLDKQDKATLPTLNENEEAFESLDIVVTAYNNVGATQAHAHVAITGAKPSVSTKEVSFTSGDALYSCKTFDLKAGKEVADASTSADIRSTVPSAVATTLAGYGLALVNWDAMYEETDETATVASGEVILNYDATNSADAIVSGKSTGTVVESGDSSGVYIASGGYVIYKTGNKTSAYTGESEDLKNKGIIQVIDTSKLVAKTNTKGESITFTLENYGAVNAKAKIKVKITAGTSSSSSTSATANAEGAKAAAKANVKSGHGYAPADETALEAEEAEETTEAEAKVTFGPARTADSLSAAQQAFLADNGYTVVAVLPEATAEADGQYDFEVVDLNENAPEGAKLVWLAFPKDGSYSEDDEIADFYDEAGAPIENVPASLKVKVSAWLRAGVTYEPVIAVKD